MPDEHPGLGRKLSIDERDANFPMRAAIRTVSTVPFVGVKRWWDNGAWLDQGATGTCVGHGWAHFVEDSPITPGGVIDPFGIYRDACKIDEWSDNDSGDLSFGTSVRAGAEVLRGRGIVLSYLWAQDRNGDAGLQDVIDAVGFLGPVVVGTNWYDQMFDPVNVRYPDSYYRKTLIIPAGDNSPVGGHCYVLNGVDTANKFFRIKNSWGQGWALKGRAYIQFDTMKRLLNEQGEAAIARQTRGA
jgi:hypothetical protein